MPTVHRSKPTLAAAALAMMASAATASAAPYTGLVVFGDSLSDVGNDTIVTGGTFPGPAYYQGRFSNGVNYVDDLAAKLGLPAPTPSVAGGTDYAYGGARTAGSDPAQRAVIHDVDQQLSSYLSTATPTASTLYDVFAGANDVIAAVSDATQAAALADVATAAANVAGTVNTLYQHGGRQFLVPNLPAVGQTPGFNTNAAASAAANGLTTAFDADLAADLASLSGSDPGLVLHTLDAAGLFASIEAKPAAYGFTDVTDQAAPGLSPGDDTYDTSQEVPNPQQYLFWDTLHPTTAGHALLGQAAYAAVVPEPAAMAAVVMAAAGLRRRRRPLSRR